jgi:hypothetical protein
MKEKTKNAITWIDGLLETQEKQGYGMLGNSKGGFCCLGYGCYKLGIDYFDERESDQRLVELTGLHDMYGTIISGYNNFVNLVELNDEAEYSFKEIANIIKENLRDVFTEDVAVELEKHYCE